MKPPKFQLFYDQVKTANQELFEKFHDLHQLYSAEELQNNSDFHSLGARVRDLLRDTERKLCAGMMRGHYASYSQKVAEKFWDLARKDFPLIDRVGIKTNKINMKGN